MRKITDHPEFYLPAAFLVARFILFLSLTDEGLRGYGDLVHFYHLATMGWPYFNLWVEFPPVFPFISRLIYLLVNGREHTYDYLLAFLFSVFQSGTIWMFIRIGLRINSKEETTRRGWVYLVLLLPLFYGWSYFDPLAILMMLLGLYWLMTDEYVKSGFALAVGTLVKIFPALALAVAWRYVPPRKALIVTALTLGITITVYSALYFTSPKMTLASLQSQLRKGSWETPWALLDHNLSSGNFGVEIERLDPVNAFKAMGNPARISSWITLIPFGLLGIWIYLHARSRNKRAMVAFLGITWVIFALWSPGWSPQWVLFFLPIILLALPEGKAYLFATALILVSLLEWPFLLSRGYFSGLWITIPLRVVLLILLGLQLWKLVARPEPAYQMEADWNINVDQS